ncbi:MAG: efflux RND transporter periplasmic adaptor subunit [Phycisphaerae bacterium]|nr:efflux RND transporter periplasmic adaptor subunit [Phycisphaerae bacterium]
MPTLFTSPPSARPAASQSWLAAASLVAWVLLLAGCDRGPATPSPAASASAPVEVEVALAVEEPVRRTVATTGTLEADEDVIVATKVAGRLSEVFVDLGDEIAVGGLLAAIDPIDAMLARDERRLALDEALARLGLDEAALDAGPDPASFPEVQRTRRQADNAKARLDRARSLLEGTAVISQQSFADLETAYEVAEEDHRLALLAADAAIAETRTLRAQLRSAEQRLLDTRITAPTGLAPAREIPDAPPIPRERLWSVADRLVGSGAYVTAGTPLFRLIDLDPLKLRVQVPEHRLGEMRLGAAAEVFGESSAEPVEGRVSRLAPAVDPRTRTFEVEILIPNPARSLRAGGFARAVIETSRGDRAILVPADAVVVYAGVEKVVAVEQGVAAEKQVETGARFGDRVEVLRGLAAGAMVARRPPATLVNGTPVSPRAAKGDAP